MAVDGPAVCLIVGQDGLDSVERDSAKLLDPLNIAYLDWIRGQHGVEIGIRLTEK